MKHELYVLSILKSDETRFIVLWYFGFSCLHVCVCVFERGHVCVCVCVCVMGVYVCYVYVCVCVCFSGGMYVIERVRQHCLVKVKTTSPCAHYEGIWRKGDKAYLTFDPVSIFRAVVSFTLFSLYPWQENFQCPLNTQICGTQNRLGPWKRGKCFYICVCVCYIWKCDVGHLNVCICSECVCVCACVCDIWKYGVGPRNACTSITISFSASPWLSLYCSPCTCSYWD